MKKKNVFAALMLTPLFLGALASCGEAKEIDYIDGTYKAQSSLHDEDEEAAGYGVIEITLEDNIIKACTYQTYMADGTLKDESYYSRENLSSDYKRQAKKAVQACERYASSLVGKNANDVSYNGSVVSGVDLVVGATYNYIEFGEALTSALEQAEPKE